MNVDPEQYKRWTPAAQETALVAVRQATAKPWRPFYCPNLTCDGKPHDEWDFNHARVDQRPPTGIDWLVWLAMSGRGSGKTRQGAEYTHRITKHVPRISLIAGTAPDARDIMLEGESGLLTIAAPDNRPVYEPSKRRLTWPSGCIGSIFSAEEPDRLRGPEMYYAWCDEAAHWPLIQQCWDNMLFGLRLGVRPHILVTTTPKRRPWLRALVKDPTTRISTVSTYANLDNLAPPFARMILSQYEGTRLGQQELHGKLLEDVEGALWTYDMIEQYREPQPDDFDRVVIAIDPAGRKKATADETGIIAAGRLGDHIYILRDRTGHYSPNGWALAAMDVYDDLGADAIVAETNFGADMVESTLRNAGYTGRFIDQHSARGKVIRAEPIVGLYEQGRVHHTQVFEDLETEQTEWVPHESNDSPNRIDAAVFAATELNHQSRPAEFASPADLQDERHLHAVG